MKIDTQNTLSFDVVVCGGGFAGVAPCEIDVDDINRYMRKRGYFGI